MPGSAIGMCSGGGFCRGTSRSGLGKLRWINLHVVDNFLKLDRRAALGLRKNNAKGNLHAVHIPVVGVIYPRDVEP